MYLYTNSITYVVKQNLISNTQDKVWKKKGKQKNGKKETPAEAQTGPLYTKPCSLRSQAYALKFWLFVAEWRMEGDIGLRLYGFVCKEGLGLQPRPMVMDL